ncbi:MAG: HDOD domain-containing protein [Cellvibrionaceae bacterium]
MSAVETVKADILNLLENDKLVLPTLPEVALQIRDIAEDPESGIQDLVQVISKDAGISARIIRVCNSPLLRGAQEIESLQMAVMRLGMEYTANLSIGLAMEQMFQATSDLVDKRLREVWEKASEIAGISHVLCKHYTSLRPDQATLAGLMHQIGILPILVYAEEHASLLKDSFTLDQVIRELSPMLGEKILTTWGFPPEIANVPLECMDFERAADETSLSDVITAAMLQSYMGSEHPLGQIDYETVTAFKRLGFEPDPQETDEENLDDEMAAAMALLNG